MVPLRKKVWYSKAQIMKPLSAEQRQCSRGTRTRRHSRPRHLTVATFLASFSRFAHGMIRVMRVAGLRASGLQGLGCRIYDFRCPDIAKPLVQRKAQLTGLLHNNHAVTETQPPPKANSIRTGLGAGRRYPGGKAYSSVPGCRFKF